jgi:hypothetical protein
MANQRNFADSVASTLNTRPARLSSRDTDLFQLGVKPVWFGTDPRDMIELWVYDSNGNIVTSLNIPATSNALTLTTVVDITGTYEYVNLDMGQYVRDMVLEQGRYSIVVNFFRTEVGSPDQRVLYVDAISPDRTELRLRLLDTTKSAELQEWVVPSVPKLEAKGLVDRTFGKLDVPGITRGLVESAVQELRSSVGTQVSYADVTTQYQMLIDKLIQDVYPRILNHMALDTTNPSIQDADFDQYVRDSVVEVLTQYQASNMIDARLNVY